MTATSFSRVPPTGAGIAALASISLARRMGVTALLDRI
jgi:hypothetical protein